MRSKRHQWHSWEQYQTVHDNRIATYVGHFILEDQVSRAETPRSVVWAGILMCVGSIEVKVDKRQEVRTRAGRLEVRTIDYTYHAYQRLGLDRVRNLLRYDNATRTPTIPMVTTSTSTTTEGETASSISAATGQRSARSSTRSTPGGWHTEVARPPRFARNPFGSDAPRKRRGDHWIRTR